MIKFKVVYSIASATLLFKLVRNTFVTAKILPSFNQEMYLWAERGQYELLPI